MSFAGRLNIYGGTLIAMVWTEDKIARRYEVDRADVLEFLRIASAAGMSISWCDRTDLPTLPAHRIALERIDESRIGASYLLRAYRRQLAHERS